MTNITNERATYFMREQLVSENKSLDKNVIQGVMSEGRQG